MASAPNLQAPSTQVVLQTLHSPGSKPTTPSWLMSAETSSTWVLGRERGSSFHWPLR
jgi:hypothetical protein